MGEKVFSAEIEIGSIDVKAWAQTEKIMLAQKLVDLPVLEEGILRRDFLSRSKQ